MPYLSTGDRLKRTKLLGEVRQPNCVVKNPVGAVIVRIRPTNYTNHRQILTVGTRNGVQNAEATHSERHHTSSHAPRTRVAVGGVAGIELIAAAHKVEPRLGDQVIKQRQVKVPGNREDIPDADLDEPACQVAAESARAGTGDRAPISFFHVGV